jgi:uncharacterized UBP type Zn finger protein
LSKIFEKLRGGPAPRVCAHLDLITDAAPGAQSCEECLKTGDRWVHLRYCRTCGFVGCCDQSKNQHARKHYQSAGHPVFQSYQPGEKWIWCFADEMYVTPQSS